MCMYMYINNRDIRRDRIGIRPHNYFHAYDKIFLIPKHIDIPQACSRWREPARRSAYSSPKWSRVNILNIKKHDIKLIITYSRYPGNEK